jgi:hypothetical protein
MMCALHKHKILPIDLMTTTACGLCFEEKVHDGFVIRSEPKALVSIDLRGRRKVLKRHFAD